MDNGSLSPSDVALLSGNGFGGFGGGLEGIIYLAIIAFMFGGGFGWGGNNVANAIGYENLATSAEVQRGFDAQNSMANQREILAAVNSGTAQSVAATNQTFHDTLGIIQNRYDELSRDISGLAVGQANMMAKQNECCCETLRAIDGVNYANALNTASINANTTAQTQKILDAIAQNKIDELQNKVNALELAQATSGVVRYPMSTTYAVPSPCFNGCGCGC